MAFIKNLPDKVTKEEFEILSLKYALIQQLEKNNILQRKYRRLQQGRKKEVLQRILPLPPHELTENAYMIVYRTSSPILVECVTKLFPFFIVDEKRQTAEDFKKLLLHFRYRPKSILLAGEESADKFWNDSRHLCIIVFAYSLKNEFILPLHNLVLEYFQKNPDFIPRTVSRRRISHGSKVSDAAHQLCRVKNIFTIARYKLQT